MKKVEFARELRCSPATITGLVARGLPVEPDGTIDRDKCLRWIVRGTSGKNGGWGVGQRGASLRDRAEALLQAAHPKLNPTIKILESTRTGSDGDYVAVLNALVRIASPTAILRFARVARRMGCTPEQTYGLALWHGCQPCLAFTEIDADDLDGFSEPSQEQWCDLLGKDFDFGRAERLHDQATAPEITPQERV